MSGAVHLIAVVTDWGWRSECGLYDPEGGAMRTVGRHELVTCKSCQRSITYTHLVRTKKPGLYHEHRRNMPQ